MIKKRFGLNGLAAFLMAAAMACCLAGCGGSAGTGGGAGGGVTDPDPGPAIEDPGPAAPVSHTVTFDANGGSVSVPGYATGDGGRIADLPVPTRYGYTFKGWSRSPGGSTVRESDSYTSDTTLYARWEPAFYTITFDACGGTVSVGSAKTGGKPLFRLDDMPVPVRGDDAFIGWYTSADGGYKRSAGSSFRGDTTLYAHWKDASGTAGTGASWSYDPNTKTLKISGSGPMGSDAPWKPFSGEIENLIIDSGVTSIGPSAFRNFGRLTGVSIPSTVTSIGDYAFCGCNGLTGVTFPAGLASIGDMAFGNCYNLTGIALPDGVTDIGDRAFFDCDALASVTLPASLARIGESAFWGCKGIASVNYKGSDTEWEHVDVAAGNDAITGKTYGDHGNCGASGGNLTWKLSGSTLEISGSGKMADFSNSPWYGLRDRITSVSIGSGVTSIGKNAFAGCTELSGVTIPSGIVSVGDNAFAGCRSLTGLSLPGSVASIGNSAFSGCTRLSGFSVPGGVTAIGDFTFYGCTGLTGVSLPAGLASIGRSAFSRCSGLTGLSVPSGVTSIGSGAFEYCTGLSGITIPSGIASVSDNMFGHCTGLTSVSIPANVKAIGEGAFESCTGLSGMTVPGSVKTIGRNAFSGCTGLVSATIGHGTEMIGNGAFNGCSALASVTLPTSIRSGVGVLFEQCGSLTDIYYATRISLADSGYRTMAEYKDHLESVWKSLSGYGTAGYKIPAAATVHYVIP